MLALLAELANVCGGCGNHLDECRDPATQGRWQVKHQVCEACRIAEADAENRAEAKTKQRGLYTAVMLDG